MAYRLAASYATANWALLVAFGLLVAAALLQTAFRRAAPARRRP